jgi:K+-sensing histidine kinase KdpD
MSDTGGSGRDHLPLESLLQRQKLFEKLTRVQRSISHGSPLQEVLDAITAGASELLDDEVVALRLIDEDDPSYSLMVSSCGLTQKLQEALRRGPIGWGAGGMAIHRNELVVIEDYSSSSESIEALAEDGLNAAMAAPVHEEGEVVGSLVVASYHSGRTYSADEREALVSFAQHVSLALTDAKAIEALREAQRSKEMFLAMVSHELKSPLTVILGTLYTLRKHHGSLPEETREQMLSSAFERAQELGSLVARVLEGARAELAAKKEDVLLSHLVRDSIKGFEQARDLVVEKIPDVLVKVDGAAARQIMGILIENAVAHSPEGSRVIVRAEVSEHDVGLSVCNEGVLPEEMDYSSLFVPFKRGNHVRSEGVGLGLYIASRLASAIEGKIDVASKDGLVQFTLRLPFHSSTTPDMRAVREMGDADYAPGDARSQALSER